MSQGKSVLVVDDGRHYRRLFKEVFGDVMPGSPFFALDSGHAAVEHLGRAPEVPMPDVVLLDRQMPGLDGYETLARLRRIPALAEMPIIMISGSNYSEHVEQARAAGADGYFVKPPDAEGYEEMARQVAIWKPEANWQPKEIVRFSCAPIALAIPPVDAPLPGMPVSATDQALATLSAACAFAQITVQRALNLKETDQILDAKRRQVIRYLMAAGWSNIEVQDFFGFSRRYLQDRRGETHLWPPLPCASRALALK